MLTGIQNNFVYFSISLNLAQHRSLVSLTFRILFFFYTNYQISQYEKFVFFLHEFKEIKIEFLKEI